MENVATTLAILLTTSLALARQPDHESIRSGVIERARSCETTIDDYAYVEAGGLGTLRLKFERFDARCRSRQEARDYYDARK